MLDLSRQYADLEKQINDAVLRICASQLYILGPEVVAFEQEAAGYLHVQHAIGCASGTDALWLALLAAGIGPGDEVITTPFSFFATASSIVRAGAKPVFVDVEETTLNIDPLAIEKRVNETHSSRLKGIMPVHLYGQCANMDRLNRIAADAKLVVIEDAAQAFGATWRGKHAGGLAAAGAFSFYPTKNLSCFGDGGLVTTNDATLADHVRRLRNHGSRQRYHHDEIGWNSRLDSLQAAILRIKLKKLNSWNTKRNERANAYDVLLKSAGLLGSKTGQGPVRLIGRSKEAFHIYHQYVIRVPRRDELRAFLTSRKIGSEVYYPVPLHLQQCFAYLGYAPGDLPNTDRAAQEVLALPMYPELTPEEQAHVVNAIAEFFS
jgi:dTDP-4-amino-4,6-dideoxygalactose transaminase